MGFSLPLFIRNDTLPLQVVLSLHSYYGCNCIFVFDCCGSCHEGMEESPAEVIKDGVTFRTEMKMQS